MNYDKPTAKMIEERDKAVDFAYSGNSEKQEPKTEPTEPTEPKVEVKQEDIDNEISEIRKLLDDISGNVEARFMSNASTEERQEMLRSAKLIKAQARRMLKTVETPHVE